MSAQRRGCKDLDQNANSNELPLLEGITGDFFLLRFPFIPKFPAVIMYCFCNHTKTPANAIFKATYKNFKHYKIFNVYKRHLEDWARVMDSG